LSKTTELHLVKPLKVMLKGSSGRNSSLKGYFTQKWSFTWNPWNNMTPDFQSSSKHKLRYFSQEISLPSLEVHTTSMNRFN